MLINSKYNELDTYVLMSLLWREKKQTEDTVRTNVSFQDKEYYFIL